MADHIRIIPTGDAATLARAIGHTNERVRGMQTRHAGTTFIPDGSTDDSGAPSGGGVLIGPGAKDQGGIARQDPDGTLKPVVDVGPIKSQLEQVDRTLDDNKQALDQANADLADAKKQLADHDQRIGQADTDLTAAKKELADHDQRIQQVNKALDDNKQALDQANTELQNASKLIDDNKQALDQTNASLKSAQADVSKALQNAQTAQSTADSATSAAGEAQKTAQDAADSAATALSAANSAKSTASDAQDAASKASSAASDAQTIAGQAQSTAGEAKSAADNASKTAGEAQTAASDAQKTADSAASNARAALVNANSALAKAKNITFQKTAPSDPAKGDVWYPLDDSGHATGMRTWDGVNWDDVTLVAGKLIVPGSIGSTLIADGAVTAPKITAGAVTADKIAAEAITGDKIQANSINASKLTLMGGNLVGDPLFQDASHTWGGNIDWVSHQKSGDGSYRDMPAIRMNLTGWNPWMTTNDHFSVVEGEFYRVGVWLSLAADSTNPTPSNTINLGLNQWDNAGGQGWGGIPVDIRQVPRIDSKTPWKYFVGNVRARFTGFARFWINLTGGSTGVHLMVWRPSIVRAADAHLLVDGSVTASKLLAGSVTADKLAANSVTSAKIVSGAVTADKIQANSIGSDKLAANSVTADKLGANSVDASKLTAGAVTADKLAANSVTADKLAAGSVDAGKLTADSVTSANIVSGAVTADKLAANSVSADKLTANSVTGDKIAANTITGDKIAANTIDGASIKGNSISGEQIKADSIATDRLQVTDLTNLLSDPIFRYDKWTGLTRRDGIDFKDTPYGEDDINTVGVLVDTGSDITASCPCLVSLNAGNPTHVGVWVIMPDGSSVDSEAMLSLTVGVDTPAGMMTATPYQCSLSSLSLGEWHWVEGIVTPQYSGRASMVVSITGGAATVKLCKAEVRHAANASLIVDGSITASKVAAGSIDADKIAANTITGDKLNVGSVASAIMTSNLFKTSGTSDYTIVNDSGVTVYKGGTPYAHLGSDTTYGLQTWNPFSNSMTDVSLMSFGAASIVETNDVITETVRVAPHRNSWTPWKDLGVIQQNGSWRRFRSPSGRFFVALVMGYKGTPANDFVYLCGNINFRENNGNISTFNDYPATHAIPGAGMAADVFTPTPFVGLITVKPNVDYAINFSIRSAHMNTGNHNINAYGHCNYRRLFIMPV